MSQKKFRFIAPCNTTGYGIAAASYARGLVSLGIDFEYNVIGNLDFPDFGIKKDWDSISNELINTRISNNFDPNLPCFVFWHLSHLDKIVEQYKVNTNKSLAFSTFEVDNLSTKEAFNASNFIKVATTNTYHSDIMKKFGLNVINPIPHGAFLNFNELRHIIYDIYGYVHFPVVSSTSEVLIASIGKFESRKGQIELLKALQLLNKHITIYASWDNPFLPSGHVTSTLMQLGFKKTSSISTLDTYSYNNIELRCYHKLSRRQIIRIMTDCYLNISVSKAEGWNLPLFEALLAINYDNMLNVKDNLIYNTYDRIIASNIPVHKEYLKDRVKLFPTSGAEPAIDNLFFHGEANWDSINVNKLAEFLYNHIEYITQGQHRTHLLSDNSTIIYKDKDFYKKFLWEENAKLIVKEMESLS